MTDNATLSNDRGTAMARPEPCRKTIRARVFARDRGICARCGCDTLALRALMIAVAAAEAERERPKRGDPLDERAAFFLELLGFPRRSSNRARTTLWEPDHIRPRSRGGRSIGRNLRTLCRRCHVLRHMKHPGPRVSYARRLVFHLGLNPDSFLAQVIDRIA